MRVAFRVDASLDMGTGHVMRCLALADALRVHGAHCRFVSREHPGNLVDLIKQHGHDVDALSFEQYADINNIADGLQPSHALWLGSSWSEDAKETISALGEAAIDWLIVDHYALDSRWEKTIRHKCRRLMVIDDLADRPHECDLLLDQNPGRKTADYIGLVPPDCTVLTGPKYALLRPEFSALREYSRARHDTTSEIKHILITMGGIDKENATGEVLSCLKHCSLRNDCRITVIMGSRAPWLAQVRKVSSSMPWTTEVLVDVQNMAELMLDSDLAIGAVGSTALERCCMGLPTLAIILADNQRAGANALQSERAILILGDSSQIAANIGVNLQLLSDSKFLKDMQQACFSITDGKGVSRIVKELINEGT